MSDRQRPEHPPPRSRGRSRGFSIVEICFGAAILTLVVGGVTSSFWTIEAAFDEQVAEAELQMKTRAAMDRLVRLAGMAITSDPEFAFADTQQRTGTVQKIASGQQVVEETATVDASASLQFREVATISNGAPVYDDEAKYFLLGPDSSTPSRGVLIGRGPDVDSVHQYAAGQDGLLGTKDDVEVEFATGTPAVEVLLAEDFSPQDGSMLEFTTVPNSDGRLVTITLRTNVQRPDGSFVRDADLVLEERVVLRW